MRSVRSLALAPALASLLLGEAPAAAAQGTHCVRPAPTPVAADTVAPRPRPPAEDPDPRGTTAPGGVADGPLQAPDEPRADAGRAPGEGPGGAVDRSEWTFWWRYNRDAFVDLRSRLQPGFAHRGGDDFFLGRGQNAVVAPARRPTIADVKDLVAPALLRALETERNGEIVAGALIALAKIGDEGCPRPLRAVFTPYLRSGDTRVAEAATLALGILGDERAVPFLLALVRSDDDGQRLVASGAVSVRMRAFAAYGLGLVADESSDEGLQRRVATALVEILEADRRARPDLQVAALSALGIVPLPWTSNVPVGSRAEAIASDRASVVAYLTQRLGLDPRRGGFADPEVRAHAPTALARLLTRGVGALPPRALDPARAEAMRALLEIVDAHSKEGSVHVLQSATNALGELADAGAGNHALARWNELAFLELVRLAKSSPHGQSEFFALMGLAQLGSRPGPVQGPGAAPFGLTKDVERELLRALTRARGPKRAWASLAIGVFGSGLLQHGAGLDASLVLAVRRECARTRRPSDAGAHAVALGLLQDLASEPLLVDRLDRFAQADTRGYIALGLGMMGAGGSMEAILELAEASRTRPDLLEPTAMGVGLLGDPAAVKRLVDLLRETKSAASLGALAGALGRIGDAQALVPLVALLGDESVPDPSRAAAAVALGVVCDPSDEAWNARLATNVNYRTNVSTLTNELGTGVLDVF